MFKNYILFNPLANSNKGKKEANNLKNNSSKYEQVFIDITKIDINDHISKIKNGDIITICGGDGTLHHFINTTQNTNFANEVYYYPCGTGNDFANDIGVKFGDKPVEISNYLKDLPKATVNGKTYTFLNNVGFGIDGYCTAVGDKMREENAKKINYTAIAIKGLL